MVTSLIIKKKKKREIREGLMCLLLPTLVRKKKNLVQKLFTRTVLKPLAWVGDSLWWCFGDDAPKVARVH